MAKHQNAHDITRKSRPFIFIPYSESKCKIFADAAMKIVRLFSCGNMFYIRRILCKRITYVLHVVHFDLASFSSFFVYIFQRQYWATVCTSAKTLCALALQQWTMIITVSNVHGLHNFWRNIIWLFFFLLHFVPSYLFHFAVLWCAFCRRYKKNKIKNGIVNFCLICLFRFSFFVISFVPSATRPMKWISNNESNRFVFCPRC